MKIITLTQKSDFIRMKEEGKKYHLPCSTVIYVQNKDPKVFRIAFALSRKFANAVVRNKVRRQIKEIIRNHLKESKSIHCDILFIPKKSIIDIEHSELIKQMQRLFVFLESN